MSIVSSYFPGRVRLRSPFLRDSDLRCAVIDAIEELGFSGTYKVNEDTGSVLVQYDPDQLTGNIIEALRPMVNEMAKLRMKVEYYTPKDKAFLLSEIERLKKEAEGRLKENG